MSGIHKRTRGGNDYLECLDCGKEWDYTKPGTEPTSCVPSAPTPAPAKEPQSIVAEINALMLKLAGGGWNDLTQAEYLHMSNECEQLSSWLNNAAESFLVASSAECTALLAQCCAEMEKTNPAAVPSAPVERIETMPMKPRDEAEKEVQSRSVLRRQAIQKGEPMPTFSAAPSGAEEVTPPKTDNIGRDLSQQLGFLPDFNSERECKLWDALVCSETQIRVHGLRARVVISEALHAQASLLADFGLKIDWLNNSQRCDRSIRQCEEFLTAGAALPVPEPPSERTPKDYAIEHGRYLATAAQNYLDEKNRYDMAVAGYAEENADVPNADSLSDHHQALRAAIYEFRKRADKSEAVPEPRPETPRDKSRCSVCGSGRAPLDREKTRFGVCTLVDCKDPLRDLNIERAAAGELKERGEQ